VNFKVNDKVAEIIRGIEAGRYPLSFDNLDMIEGTHRGG